MTVLTILCGGKSQRMARDKALLEIDGETLLARHIRLATATGLAVQIAAGGQDFPLPATVTATSDHLPDQAGPLSALAGALKSAQAAGHAGTYLLPVDTLITPQQLLAALAPKQPAAAIMIVRDGRPQPLLAWYSVALLARVEAWLATGIRNMMPLAAVSDVRHVVMPADWAGLDNFNTPDEWQAAQTLFQQGLL